METARQQIVRLMLRDPLKWWYGREIGVATKLGRGTVLIALHATENDGMLDTRWEDKEGAEKDGRPTRLFYRLRGHRISSARRELDPSPSGNPWLSPQPAPAVKKK